MPPLDMVPQSDAQLVRYSYSPQDVGVVPPSVQSFIPPSSPEFPATPPSPGVVPPLPGLFPAAPLLPPDSLVPPVAPIPPEPLPPPVPFPLPPVPPAPGLPQSQELHSPLAEHNCPPAHAPAPTQVRVSPGVHTSEPGPASLCDEVNPFVCVVPHASTLSATGSNRSDRTAYGRARERREWEWGGDGGGDEDMAQSRPYPIGPPVVMFPKRLHRAGERG